MRKRKRERGREREKILVKYQFRNLYSQIFILFLFSTPKHHEKKLYITSMQYLHDLICGSPVSTSANEVIEAILALEEGSLNFILFFTLNSLTLRLISGLSCDG